METAGQDHPAFPRSALPARTFAHRGVVAQQGPQAGPMPWPAGGGRRGPPVRARAHGLAAHNRADRSIPAARQRDGRPGRAARRGASVRGRRRVSIGTAITQAAYTLAKRTATKLLTTGSYAELEVALDFSTINSLFAPL